MGSGYLKYFLFSAIPIATLLYLTLGSRPAATPNTENASAPKVSKIEQLRRDGVIKWRQVWQLEEIGFTGDWIETSDANRCPLATDVNVFCKIFVQPKQQVELPLPNRTCYGSTVGHGKVRAQIQSNSGWANWHDLVQPVSYNLMKDQHHRVRFELYPGINEPQPVYVVRIPEARAGSLCSRNHFEAVWMTVR